MCTKSCNCIATAWQQHGNCIATALSLSHVYFYFLHDNNMSTAWQLLLTFTFSRSLSLFAWQQHGNRLETASHFLFLTSSFTFCMATAWKISQTVFLKRYFSKYISPYVFLTMYFSKCIYQNVFLKMYFSKCIQSIITHQSHISQVS